jgi:SAM-dependent methyltransferase
MAATIDAQFFWANHPGRSVWCARYWMTADDAPRDWVIDGLRHLGPVKTVLEIGCHCGPLLKRLKESGYTAGGVDINATAVEEARRLGLNASVGAVPDVLSRFADREIDAVVSSYCLAYIAPDDLAETLGECLRIARMGLVIAEPMARSGDESGLYEADPYVEWRHDYFEAVERGRRRLPGDPMLRTMIYPYDVVNDVNGVLVARWV